MPLGAAACLRAKEVGGEVRVVATFLSGGHVGVFVWKRKESGAAF